MTHVAVGKLATGAVAAPQTFGQDFTFGGYA
jgi:hypothetical protein